MPVCLIALLCCAPPELTFPCLLLLLLLPPAYISPHPQPEEGEDEVECYTPFQFMLQFMLQPLLVESGSTAAGAFIPALRKMCAYIKFTADRAVSGSADMAGCNGCKR
jgi:hypothetical protein